MKKSIDKLPYFETKVVKVVSESNRKFKKLQREAKEINRILDSLFIKYSWKDNGKELTYNVDCKISKKQPKGNWVNGENLDKIKFPCFCSYTHGSKKVGILLKLGNNFYIINIGGQGDYTKYFLSYDLKHLIKDFDIHILKGKIIIFEEEK